MRTSILSGHICLLTFFFFIFFANSWKKERINDLNFWNKKYNSSKLFLCIIYSILYNRLCIVLYIILPLLYICFEKVIDIKNLAYIIYTFNLYFQTRTWLKSISLVNSNINKQYIYLRTSFFTRNSFNDHWRVLHYYNRGFKF